MQPRQQETQKWASRSPGKPDTTEPGNLEPRRRRKSFARRLGGETSVKDAPSHDSETQSIDPVAVARERAGANFTINYEETNAREALMELTGGRGPDACIDAVGLEAHAPGLQGFITHRMKLTDAPVGFDIFNDKEDDCLKVVLNP